MVKLQAHGTQTYKTNNKAVKNDYLQTAAKTLISSLYMSEKNSYAKLTGILWVISGG